MTSKWWLWSEWWWELRWEQGYICTSITEAPQSQWPGETEKKSFSVRQRRDQRSGKLCGVLLWNGEHMSTTFKSSSRKVEPCKWCDAKIRRPSQHTLEHVQAAIDFTTEQITMREVKYFEMSLCDGASDDKFSSVLALMKRCDEYAIVASDELTEKIFMRAMTIRRKEMWASVCTFLQD